MAVLITAASAIAQFEPEIDRRRPLVVPPNSQTPVEQEVRARHFVLVDEKGRDRASLVADRERTLLLSGTGDVIEPDGPAAAVGSGGTYALAAARALHDNTTLSAREIGERAMKIAGEICIYTNNQHVFEEL